MRYDKFEKLVELHDLRKRVTRSNLSKKDKKTINKLLRKGRKLKYVSAWGGGGHGGTRL